MPHTRQRHALVQLLKKIRFSPIITIQGARQTGKSTLARELLDNQYYISFDQSSKRLSAEQSLDIFLQEEMQKAGQKLLVIDEAQKVPALFDQIKFIVDQNKKPGRFLLLGSTEFSKELRIKESLTGRLSRMRLYPMTIEESFQKPFSPLDDRGLFHSKAIISRTELVKYLLNGGYPGIFAVRSQEERSEKWEELVGLTCERDALMFPLLKGDSDLCRRILNTVATHDEPNLANIASALKSNTKKVATQIKILCQLFILHQLRPHPLGTGKTLYFLNDSGLAAHLGADFPRRLEVATLLQLLARRSYSAKRYPDLYYYRTTKGSRVHFLTQEGTHKIHACKLVFTDKIDHREFEILKSLGEKAEKNGFKTTLSALCSTSGVLKKEKIKMQEWECIGS